MAWSERPSRQHSRKCQSPCAASGAATKSSLLSAPPERRVAASPGIRAAPHLARVRWSAAAASASASFLGWR
eukprot:9607417-Lingulodinium_polyedra.AAC.1